MAATPSFRLDADAYGAGLRQPFHRHDALHLSLVLGGSIRERIAGRELIAGPLTLLAKDPGVHHADDFGPRGALLARITVPGRGLADLVDRPDRVEPWRWSRDPLAVAAFLRLLSSRDAGPIAEDDADLVDLLGACSQRAASTPRGAPPAWLSEVAARIDAEWSPRRRVGAFAKNAGVHPVHLARAYRRWFGVGLGAAVRWQRLAAAAAALAGGTRSVATAAHGCGFADEAHLCRAFRQAVGTTPGQYRRLIERLPWVHRRGRPTRV